MRYVEFSLDKIRRVLKPANGWTETIPLSTCEYVYVQDIVGFPNLKVKVFSSVDIFTGWSRLKGRDSIKVSVVQIDPMTGRENPVIPRIHHVYRTINWVANLFPVITTAKRMAIHAASSAQSKPCHGRLPA